MDHHPTQAPSMGLPVYPLPAGLARLSTAAAPGVAPPLHPTKDDATRLAGAGGIKGESKADKADGAEVTKQSQHLREQPEQRPRLSPRQSRALSALLAGPVTREQMDRTTGASNRPDVVRRVREKLGLLIPCCTREVIDRDGRKVDVGIGSLNEQDRIKADAYQLALAQEGKQ